MSMPLMLQRAQTAITTRGMVNRGYALTSLPLLNTLPTVWPSGQTYVSMPEFSSGNSEVRVKQTIICLKSPSNALFKSKNDISAVFQMRSWSFCAKKQNISYFCWPTQLKWASSSLAICHWVGGASALLCNLLLRAEEPPPPSPSLRAVYRITIACSPSTLPSLVIVYLICFCLFIFSLNKKAS